ncbi:MULTISPECIES: fatty acid desaturase family protein [Roseobacteraceae]|uniref:Delta(12)-fatty-acid desaturase n=1 Tax=Pseudosulfitobacter pseudonitzschiae TaxID=1402135 RepID=A0A221K3H5_9RHOB|nr:MULTISPECIES: fatty acid desaturase family protein [Roseobacteraceae]ASM73551.1 Delta(12)-fatty-acid desaturase [Pseudosulfitobacter pseudonitzschiae]
MTPGKAFLTSDEIRPLAQRSDLMGAWLVAHCWGTIAFAIGLFALWPNPATFLLAVILIGSRQLGLAILMHEAAHSALFKSRKLNDWVGEWLCGWPIMADLHAYRHYHLTHHRFTQTDKDPDLALSLKFPTSHASMRRKFLRDLTGQTGIKQLAGQILMFIQLAGDDDAIDAAKTQSAQAFKSNTLGRAFPVFIGIALAISLVGDWWWGLAFWLLPYLTWFQFVLRVRNIAEHGAVEQSDNPLQNVRTTHAGPVARTLVAPYYVNYHLEHHMVMHVPCWQLPKMHALLMTKGLGGQMRTAPNYRAAMMEAGWRSS